MSSIAPGVTMSFEEGVESMTFMKDSPTYGVKTKYLRTTIKARLQPDFDLQSIPIATGNSHSEFDFHSRALRRRQCRPYCCRQSISDTQVEACTILAKHSAAIILPTQSDTKSTHQVCLWLGDRDFHIL